MTRVASKFIVLRHIALWTSFIYSKPLRITQCQSSAYWNTLFFLLGDGLIID